MATPTPAPSNNIDDNNATSVDETTTMTISPSPPPPTVVTLQSLLPPLPTNSRRIYLLRHGETDWNLLGKIQGGGYDIPLNNNGKLQARKAATELDGIPLDIIASSSLVRAKETADILHARHDDGSTTAAGCGGNSGVRIHRVVDSGLNEVSFGEWEGFASKDSTVDRAEVERFKDTARRVKSDPNYKFPGGGESTKQVEERSVAALHRILNYNVNTAIDAGTSSSSSSNEEEEDHSQQHRQHRHIAIVSHGRTNKVLIAATALGDARRFQEVKQSNVAINVMDIDDTSGTWTLHVVNFIDHVKGNVIVKL